MLVPSHEIRLRSIADVVMPVHFPIIGIDGKELREIPVPKGTLILPSLAACNVATEIWGVDAKEWRPERWLAPLPHSVSEARVPGIYSNM